MTTLDLDDDERDRLGDSVAARYVLFVLRSEGALTPTELQDMTGLSKSGVQHALRRLHDADLVERRRKLRNRREVLYRPVEAEPEA